MLYSILYTILSFMILILVVVIYPNVPETIPIHFDANGIVNGYGNKSMLFVFAVVPVIFALLGIFLIYHFRKDKQNLKFAKIFSIAMVGLQDVLMILLIYVSLAISDMGAEYDVNRILVISIGILFLILGNILPKCRQNSLMGVRTRWTLADRTVWEKTHVVAGIIFYISGGFTLILTVFSFNFSLELIALGVLMCIDTIILVVYSYWLSRKKKSVS